MQRKFRGKGIRKLITTKAKNSKMDIKSKKKNIKRRKKY